MVHVMTAVTIEAAAPRVPAETVVLIHGLSRTHRSLRRLGNHLARAGYAVVCVDYPAGRRPIEDLSLDLDGVLASHVGAASPRLHFVTHSFGGILLRYYLRDHAPPNLGRVVMLAPPNGGSELADVLGKVPAARRLAGPNRPRMGTAATSLPAILGPVAFDLGVITGDRSINPIFSKLIPGPDDGFVAVERARVAGMSDFLVVRRTHAFIMARADVMAQVATFLQDGAFERPRDGGAR